MNEQDCIYILQEYEYSVYSYSGIEPSVSYMHRSLVGAKLRALNMGLTVVDCGSLSDPVTQATIERVDLHD